MGLPRKRGRRSPRSRPEPPREQKSGMGPPGEQKSRMGPLKIQSRAGASREQGRLGRPKGLEWPL